LLVLLSSSACVSVRLVPKAAVRPSDGEVPCAFAWPSVDPKPRIPIHEPACRSFPDASFVRPIAESAVIVRVKRADPETGRQESFVGTGVVVGRGAVLTSRHLVRNALAVQVRVRRVDVEGADFQVAAQIDMTVAASSAHWDAAVLVPSDGAVSRLLPPPLPVCRRLPSAGERLWHFGNRTAWSVATVHRPTEDLWGETVITVTDTMVYYGDSGGPVVDGHGSVVGLLVRLSTAEPGVAYVTPIGPALDALGYCGNGEVCE
jgi:hypothetical protein